MLLTFGPLLGGLPAAALVFRDGLLTILAEYAHAPSRSDGSLPVGSCNQDDNCALDGCVAQ